MHKYIADKRIIFGTAGVLVVGIVLAVVLSGRNRPTPSAEASPAIVLKLPDNSPLAKHNPRATVIENPAMLPQAPDGVKLLAAGRFEPSGLQFPDGITVTRPLLESRPVGARLTIAVLDESTSRWIDTGERAVVADSGRAATGIVYHFSVLGAVRGTIEAKGEPTTDPPDVKKKDDDPSKKLPLSIITWKFTKLDTEKVVDARGLDLKKGAEELNKALSGVTDVAADNVKKTQDVFRKYSFEEVEKIAKAHLLDKPVSDILARHRRELINKALSEAMNAVDPGRQFTLGALDSGNKKSGIASDVDQTLFLIPRDPKDGKGVNFSELNNRLITAFNEKFQAANGYPPARLGIESMNGADFFPDWKQEQSVADFKAEADRV